MFRKLVCYVVSVLIIAWGLEVSVSAQEVERQNASIERIRIEINRLGTGERARAKITLRNGTKMKGYVAQINDNSLVLRDRQTDAPTTISYSDVVRVEKNRGHSTARNIAIGVGIGVGALLTIIAITLAHLD